MNYSFQYDKLFVGVYTNIRVQRTTNSERRHTPTMMAQDDDDNFMPPRPLPPRPPSPEETDDAEDDGGFACTRPYNFPSPPQRRQPLYPNSFDWYNWYSYGNLRRNFPPSP
uniref:Uncharacterized protein n=1 Tax=Arundo donax TaxID=35708 RepID=A0A0A9BBL8_ARUDO